MNDNKDENLELIIIMEEGDILKWSMAKSSNEYCILDLVKDMLRSRICGFFKKNGTCAISSQICSAMSCPVPDECLLENDEEQGEPMFNSISKMLDDMKEIQVRYNEDVDKEELNKLMKKIEELT